MAVIVCVGLVGLVRVCGLLGTHLQKLSLRRLPLRRSVRGMVIGGMRYSCFVTSSRWTSLSSVYAMPFNPSRIDLA